MLTIKCPGCSTKEHYSIASTQIRYCVHCGRDFRAMGVDVDGIFQEIQAATKWSARVIHLYIILPFFVATICFMTVVFSDYGAVYGDLITMAFLVVFFAAVSGMFIVSFVKNKKFPNLPQ